MDQDLEKGKKILSLLLGHSCLPLRRRVCVYFRYCSLIAGIYKGKKEERKEICEKTKSRYYIRNLRELIARFCYSSAYFRGDLLLVCQCVVNVLLKKEHSFFILLETYYVFIVQRNNEQKDPGKRKSK